MMVWSFRQGANTLGSLEVNNWNLFHFTFSDARAAGFGVQRYSYQQLPDKKDKGG